MKTPEGSVRPPAQIEAAVMAEGREWMRQRLEKELQQLADEQGEVFPPKRAAADSSARSGVANYRRTAGGCGAGADFSSLPSYAARRFRKNILRLLAANRNPESYVAGATVFLRREDSHRQSQDIDVFHDTVQSLKRTSAQDGAVLQQNGYTLEWVDTQETLQRATVSKAGHFSRLIRAH